MSIAAVRKYNLLFLCVAIIYVINAIGMSHHNHGLGSVAVSSAGTKQSVGITHRVPGPDTCEACQFEQLLPHLGQSFITQLNELAILRTRFAVRQHTAPTVILYFKCSRAPPVC